MASLTVRKNEPEKQAPALSRWDSPFRMLRDFWRLDPFEEMTRAWPAWFNAPERELIFAPAFEVKETKDTYLFKADVPGMKEHDLDITLTGNRLTIKGAREAEQEEKTDTYYTCERSYGSFTRSFMLPDGADLDHIRSDLKDGVLTLVVPKKPEVQPKKIQLQGSSSTKA